MFTLCVTAWVLASDVLWQKGIERPHLPGPKKAEQKPVCISERAGQDKETESGFCPRGPVSGEAEFYCTEGSETSGAQWKGQTRPPQQIRHHPIGGSLSIGVHYAIPEGLEDITSFYPQAGRAFTSQPVSQASGTNKTFYAATRIYPPATWLRANLTRALVLSLPTAGLPLSHPSSAFLLHSAWILPKPLLPRVPRGLRATLALCHVPRLGHRL